MIGENGLQKNENGSEDGVVEHSKEQELESRKNLSEILSLEILKGCQWRVTTAEYAFTQMHNAHFCKNID